MSGLLFKAYNQFNLEIGEERYRHQLAINYPHRSTAGPFSLDNLSTGLRIIKFCVGTDVWFDRFDAQLTRLETVTCHHIQASH
jgi:hypothetical protein